MDETRELAAFVSGLRYEDLPPPLVAKAKMLLLDHFGVSLFSSRTAWGKIATKYANRFAAMPESTVYGQERKVAAEAAALANGLCAHGYELDDSAEGAYAHPGASVIPAAFALGETLDSSGRDLITAMAAGYELIGRIGNVLGREGIRWHHPTCQLGAFGATAAACRMLSLDEAQTLNALGIAGSMASGIMQFSDETEGTMVKRFHGGWPAHSGVIAARLAADGFTGPSQVLEGRYGYLRTITDKFEVSGLTKDLGTTWTIMTTAIKLYASCRAFHPMIEAIEKLKKEHQIGADVIDRIRVATTEVVMSKQITYEPKSLMGAQYSLPFVAAMSVHRDLSDIRCFDEDAMNDKLVLATAKRVDAFVDAEVDQAYPRYVAKVTMTTKDGRELRQDVWDAKGSSLRPAPDLEMVKKFSSLTEGIITGDHAVVDQVGGLDKGSSLAALGAALRSTAQPPAYT
ncbi:MAG: MmgE/PrpD family protein [Pseudolabrys sp.]